MQRLILRSRQSPGDIVMLTAAVRDLHRAHPGKFQTDVRTTAQELWDHNPHLTPLSEEDRDVRTIEMHYPLIHSSNQKPYHFVHGYTQYLEQRLGLTIPVTEFRGDIHLSPIETEQPPQFDGVDLPERFWIVMAGGKYDFTAKWWNPKSYAAVVEHFAGKITFLQCGEMGHWHPSLGSAVNLVGRTSIREFVRLMHFADGVLCPVTMAMHLAAAVPVRANGPPNRACVVLAGGREPPHWEAYPQHQFFHTVGQLDCCQTGGCWKSRCQRVGDGDEKDRRNLCERPVEVGENLVIPQCLEMIRPAEVIAAIERILEGWSMSRSSIPTSSLPVAKASRTEVASTPQSARIRPRNRSVLIDFRHGLGDAAQFTAVLRHLKHYHPRWEIDVAALRGQHTAFGGLVRNSFVLDDMRSMGNGHTDVFRLDWSENEGADPRWPSTKTTRCLLDIFRLTPIAELCRYSIAVSDVARSRARKYLESICGETTGLNRYPAVLLHYQGNTSTAKKNLAHDVAERLCRSIRDQGCTPILLDWDRRSPLPHTLGVESPGADHPLWMGTRRGDAEQLAALIESSRLMVGIDSGPLHVAGATSTPTIGVWTQHHPVHFFDLASHVTHLVPVDHARLAKGAPAVEYFERAYRHQLYRDLNSDLCDAVTSHLAVPAAARAARTETALPRVRRHDRTKLEINGRRREPHGQRLLKAEQQRPLGESVSIIIAARNNGRYLQEAISSALDQDHPCEVIYADDGSTDDSLAIARCFQDRGLSVLESHGHQGVCAARNRGASVAKHDYFVFLDGDDRLPMDFLSRHFQEMTPGTPFVYGPANAFGEGPLAGIHWGVPQWRDYDRWQTNTVNTSALYARWAFLAAGGWRDLATMWDWDLALRAARLGTPRPSTATLEYRQHGTSWSHQIGEKVDGSRELFLGEIRRANARLSVGTILSGRVPDLFCKWMEALVYSVRCMELRTPPELVLLDNSRDPEFAAQISSVVATYTSTFSSIRIIPHGKAYSYSDEKGRRDAVASFMAEASRVLTDAFRGDIFWLVEDDILVPLLGGQTLWNCVTQGWHPPAAVAGCYRNRHVPDQYVGGWWRREGPIELRELPGNAEAFDVDFTGTGCLMFWKHYGAADWESHCQGVPAHDWAWCQSVRRNGKRVLMHPGVRCGHARSETDIIPG